MKGLAGSILEHCESFHIFSNILRLEQSVKIPEQCIKETANKEQSHHDGNPVELILVGEVADNRSKNQQQISMMILSGHNHTENKYNACDYESNPSEYCVSFHFLPHN